MIGRLFNNIDISEINKKKDQDKERRLSKKLAKKKLRIQALKTEKMRAKHKICLVCKKKGHVAADCREVQTFLNQIECIIRDNML